MVRPDQSTKAPRSVKKSSAVRLKLPLAISAENENRMEINNNSSVKNSTGKYVLNLFFKTSGLNGVFPNFKHTNIEKYSQVLPQINLLMFS